MKNETPSKMSIAAKVVLGLPKTLMIVVYLGLAYLAWMCLGPEKFVPGPNREKATEQIVNQIVLKLRENRGELKTVLLPNFAEDRTGCFSDALRSRIATSGILDINEKPLIDKIRSRLNLKLSGVDNVEDAMKVASVDGFDGVFCGRLERYEELDGGVLIKGAWQLLDVKTAAVLHKDNFEVDTITSTAAKIKQSIRDMATDAHRSAGPFTRIAWQIRVLGYLLVTLLLPVVTITFVRAMVAKRSNKVNAFILGIYTVVDAILAFFMIGGAFVSTTATVIFIFAALFAFIYNTTLMSFALRLEDK